MNKIKFRYLFTCMSTMEARTILTLLLLSQVALGTAKIYLTCDLAEYLSKNGFKSSTIGNWICLSKFTSGFNTALKEGPLEDGSFNYGIFQINEKYCKPGSKYSCAKNCADLLTNDLKASANCALKIYNKLGFSAWPTWTEKCKGRSVGQFIERCSHKSMTFSNSES